AVAERTQLAWLEEPDEHVLHVEADAEIPALVGIGNARHGRGRVAAGLKACDAVDPGQPRSPPVARSGQRAQMQRELERHPTVVLRDVDAVAARPELCAGELAEVCRWKVAQPEVEQ